MERGTGGAVSGAPDPDSTVCGLPLIGAGDIAAPVLGAVVVVKSFDPDGDCGVAYQAYATDGLPALEAEAMYRYGARRLQQAIDGTGGEG